MPYADKEKKNQMLRKIYARKRAEVIESLGGKCKNCPEDDLIVLQIDHIKPIQKKAGDRPSNRKMIKMILRGELKLSDFQVLCANCHVRKTKQDVYK